MISGAQPKILLTQMEDGTLKIDDTMNQLLFGNPTWKLVRTRDGLTKTAQNIRWIEWHEDGTFKEKHDVIAVGRSLLMSPFNKGFTWQTTNVTKIVEAAEDGSYIKFNTENSTYLLTQEDQ